MNLDSQRRLSAIYERSGFLVKIYGESVLCIWRRSSESWFESLSHEGRLEDIDEEDVRVYRRVDDWQEVNLEQEV